MKQQVNKTVRMSSAAMLMVLMLLIQLVQCFHTHSWLPGNHLPNQTPQGGIIALHHCAICDFHFARDADDYKDSYCIPSLPIVFANFNTYISHRKLLHTCYFISLRGPPVSGSPFPAGVLL